MLHLKNKLMYWADIWMPIVIEWFLVGLIFYFLTFKCQGSTAAVIVSPVDIIFVEGTMYFMLLSCLEATIKT